MQKKQINVRLPKRLKEEVYRKSQKLGISMNDYMLLAIQEKLEIQRNRTIF